MTTYCQPEDINVGNLMLPDGDSRVPFITEAQDEMDGKLGWMYKTPIDVSKVLYHERLMLKTICRKLATGRMVTTLAIPDESGSLHAYGRGMIREALDELHQIASGDVALSAERADLMKPGDEPDPTGIGAMNARRPTVYNPDSESAVTAFNHTVFGGRPWSVEPDDNA